MRRPVLLFAALSLGLTAAAPTAAEVVERSADRFVLRYSAPLDASPAQIRALTPQVSRWWDGAHSYTGDAANLSLDVSPGGCWCERMPDGSDFDHGRTVEATDEQLLFDAPFGPLRGKAALARLTMSWPSDAEGQALVWDFVVEGPGVGAMADDVDAVMDAGFHRFIRFARNGSPLAVEPS